MIRIVSLALVGSAVARLSSQQLPPVRQIGRLEHVTTDSLASANAVVQLRDGRVLVNDVRSRRLLLFDSTLALDRAIADATSATANAYGRGFASLFPFRGDSALFVDLESLSMYVIGPAGAFARIMAIPRPDDAQRLLPVFGRPGFDVRGRLVYATGGSAGVEVRCCVGSGPRISDANGHFAAGRSLIAKPDSAHLVAVDLLTRSADTIAAIKVSSVRQYYVTGADGFLTAIEQTRVPLPVLDGWTVLRDGTVAVVRGRDYHIDLLDGNGRWTSSPKLPFTWIRLDDERKRAIIDSAAKADQAQAETNARLRAAQVAARGASAHGGGRGGGGGRGAGMGGPTQQEIPAVIVPADLADIPDYVPPFVDRAVYADAENNAWIRTSTILNGRPVYDVVDRRGELVDRVQLPAFRTIAGFGPGVIYMAVQDAAGAVHLERARVHQEVK